MKRIIDKTAVVTGAAGFVGRHTALHLSRHGYRVIGIGHGDWTRSEWTEWGVSDWLRADVNLTSLGQLGQPSGLSTIVHCAGGSTVSLSYSDPHADYERSVSSTAAVLEFSRRLDSRPRVVLASSAAVYGDQGDVDVTENATRSPISPYGFSKLAAENLCDTYSRFFEVPVSIVRLFSVYGAGLRKQLLWDAMLKYGAGKPQFLGTGNDLRDWIHVNDAAELLYLAGTAAQTSFEVYNGGHTKATTRQVIIELAGFIGHTQQPFFNGETHAGNPRRLTSNCAHARRQLNWEPTTKLRDGLASYVAWYKKKERP
jgi:UDP-glucose 4-epimerase